MEIPAFIPQKAREPAGITTQLNGYEKFISNRFGCDPIISDDLIFVFLSYLLNIGWFVEDRYAGPLHLPEYFEWILFTLCRIKIIPQYSPYYLYFSRQIKIIRWGGISRVTTVYRAGIRWFTSQYFDSGWQTSAPGNRFRNFLNDGIGPNRLLLIHFLFMHISLLTAKQLQ